MIDWDEFDYASSYNVLFSDDGQEWWNAYSVSNGNGGRDYIGLPDASGRWIKLAMKTSSRGRGFSFKHLTLKPPEFAGSPNQLFHAIAAEVPKGWYPKYFLDQQAYWTIVGVDGDIKEALINEYGQVEVDRGRFSLEPFLFVNKRLVTWNDVAISQSLLDGYVPVPSVEWNYGDQLFLTVQIVATGVPGNSQILLRYMIEAHGPQVAGKLFIALRPFQVNPPWQSLGMNGGIVRVDSIRYEKGNVQADSKVIIPITRPTAFGAQEFDHGEIVNDMSRGVPPANQSVHDHTGFSSAALQYDFDLQPGEKKDVIIAVPFQEVNGNTPSTMATGDDVQYYESMLGATVAQWRSKLDKLGITLPHGEQLIINVLKSNLAYILINRDGPAIQPGSRTYERSWIRDGSLTATALLQTGNFREARQFIDWYAQYQYPNGKIPCVVDTRGADPTNEHDSHGEFIYAVMQYFRFTKDTVWLWGKWDRVVQTVRFIQSLRAERKTEIYRTGTPEQRPCYGLMPESISHEGYSSKPMHSYWDDFFTLRGLMDATDMARVLGDKRAHDQFAAERDDFKKDLYNSMRVAMQNKQIDYIPGCVELGDFDATSTTIGIDPGGELGNIPEPQLHNTFDKYFDFFSKREHNTIEWNDYTPYETRVIGAFVRLGEKERALDAMRYFLKDMRPAAWHHWAEVVHRNPQTPGFIGDMPHTWVGSDFMRSVRSMFVYERERDSALVVGAGVAEAWLEEDGLSAKELPTYYGRLTFRMKRDGGSVLADLSGNLEIPWGGIVLKSPRSRQLKAVRVDGVEEKQFTKNEIILLRLPVNVTFIYE